MKTGKLDVLMNGNRMRPLEIFLGLGLVYLLLISFEIPEIFRSGATFSSKEDINGILKPFQLKIEEEVQMMAAPVRPYREPFRVSQSTFVIKSGRRMEESPPIMSGLSYADYNETKRSITVLEKSAKEAWESGRNLWRELNSMTVEMEKKTSNNRIESCPNSISLSGSEFGKSGNLILLPCGLTLGSHITVVGKPYPAHEEYNPKITLLKDGSGPVLVSQFMMELQGLKSVDGEDPPRIFHFNPRLKGDWSGKPVIEQNTCYRMQWGSALRCEGLESKGDEERVDGQVKCQKWIQNDKNQSEETKPTWWFNQIINRSKKVTVDWPYPFQEDKLFVLTLSAGFEGYHVNVDGRHVTSFPYRTGFVLEDATGLSINGDIGVKSIYAGSLPSSHPSFAPQKILEMSTSWRAPPLANGPIELFIGILSAGNHFAERMAVRKSWMQSKLIKSSNVVARFFVALNGRREINAQLKKEAEFFGDIVVVPFMDSYDLVVLKTVAICEYGVRIVSAKYIMKCDDDTFVRLDSVINEVKGVPNDQSLYVGNINYHHKPLRVGKWAVSYEEWPEEDYPPYANGPGYIVSSDIANFIVSEFEQSTLRLFKMEDVSMGMWVEKFNSTRRPVKYVHDLKFCQYGCMDDYYTAHYQSPRQMICLWEKLQMGKPQCCNMR